MKIIELSELSNGAHRNMNSEAFLTPPEGWAKIPDEMDLPASYPFVKVEAEEIDGVMTVTNLTPSTVPEPEPRPDPSNNYVTYEDLAAAIREGVNSVD